MYYFLQNNGIEKGKSEHGVRIPDLVLYSSLELPMLVLVCCAFSMALLISIKFNLFCSIFHLDI